MSLKMIKDSSNLMSQNFLELDHSGSDLTIFFTGNPNGCHLLTIKEVGTIRAAREYLRSPFFSEFEDSHKLSGF